MGYGIKLHVWGDFACFTRPEMKTERVSYDVMTPSAARGILEAIHWKPAIRWVIDKIHVLNEIRFDSVRRNEVERKIPSRLVNQAMKEMRLTYTNMLPPRDSNASLSSATSPTSSKPLLKPQTEPAVRHCRKTTI